MLSETWRRNPCSLKGEGEHGKRGGKMGSRGEENQAGLCTCSRSPRGSESRCVPWGHGVFKSCTGTSAFAISSIEK